MNTDTPTPRTDDLRDKWIASESSNNDDRIGNDILNSHETLELQLAAVTEQRDYIQELYTEIIKDYNKITEQRDRLAEALWNMLNQEHGSAVKAGILLRKLGIQSLNQPNDIVKTESKTEIINTIKSISAKWRNEGEGYSTSYEPHDIFKICSDEIDQVLNQPPQDFD